LQRRPDNQGFRALYVLNRVNMSQRQYPVLHPKLAGCQANLAYRLLYAAFRLGHVSAVELQHFHNTDVGSLRQLALVTDFRRFSIKT
jgi:hypothetical protein